MGKTAQPASVIVITGIQTAGKSTVARLLAQRFERGVHIEADVLYQMIVAGRVLPKEPGVMPPEAERQLRLRLRNACLLARSFYEAGFSVVIDEIIIGARYDHLKEDLAGLPFDLVVLAPAARSCREGPRSWPRQAPSRRKVGDLPRPRIAGHDGRDRPLDRQQRANARRDGR